MGEAFLWDAVGAAALFALVACTMSPEAYETEKGFTCSLVAIASRSR